MKSILAFLAALVGIMVVVPLFLLVFMLIVGFWANLLGMAL
jgi:hypothetical protein